MVKILEKVSFIMTVFNESRSIGLFLDSLFCQESMPSEIIITDGGSTDDTCKVIAGYFMHLCKTYQYDTAGSDSTNGSIIAVNGKTGKVFEGISDSGIRLLLLIARGSRISSGRNISIKNASGDFVCISDGGCIAGRDWFNEISRYYYSNPAGEVTGGYSFPYADSFFKACLAVCILPKKNEINPGSFMPSSRNIGFVKHAWEKAGGYPENMDYGEDMKFNFNLIYSGFSIKFNPQAEVYWNLRNNPAAVFRQFFRYAKGDAVGRMYPYRHAIRAVSLLLLAAVITASIIISPYVLFLLLILMAAYSYKPYLRINYFLKNRLACPFIKNKKYLASARLKIVFLIPLMLIYIDIAKLSGYIFGIVKRKSENFK